MSFLNNNIIITDKCQAKLKRLEERIIYKEQLIYPISKVLEGSSWKAEESDKLKRFIDCGKFLTIDPTSGAILKANFCKQRLCPVCNYIKSCVNWHKIKNCIEWIKEEENNPNFVFMTLTVKNCEAEELSKTIDCLTQGFRRLTNRKTWKKTVTGAIRGLEITYNEKEHTFHPHIHILVAVPEDYFKPECDHYISIDQLRSWWSESAKLNYFVQVDIKAINQTDNAIAEVAKYSIKMADLLKADTNEELIKATQTIYNCSYGRRLIATLGNFKKAMKELKQSDLDELELNEIGSHEQAIDFLFDSSEGLFKRGI